MKSIIKRLLISCLVMIGTMTSYTQSDQVTVLNDVISTLKGEQGNSDIKSFATMKEACNSRYLTCNRKGRIVGLDFQFANLNGYIPEKINQLVDLEYINLAFNYLDGSLPEGLSDLRKLEEISLNGNFLEGPLPKDIRILSKEVYIDLTQNTFKKVDPRWVKKLNITNQFNLDGCRSPDSIFLAVDLFKSKDDEVLDAVVPDIDTSAFKIVESMPRFPGCEKEDLTEDERSSCSQNKMLQFIYRNLKYPYEARTEGVEGMVVVQFVVLKNGDIGGAVVKRDPGGRCGNAALWIVNRMNFICDKWVPGIQNGNEVKVQYTLPVKFKLEG